MKALLIIIETVKNMLPCYVVAYLENRLMMKMKIVMLIITKDIYLVIIFQALCLTHYLCLLIVFYVDNMFNWL